jgi:hypothetical protein
MRLGQLWSNAKTSNQISSLVLSSVVALAPLPFGSTAPATVALWCIVLGLGLILADVRSLRRKQLLCIALLAMLVLVFAAVLHEQLASDPWSGIAVAPIWQEASKLLGTDLEPARTIVRTQPIFAIGPPLAAALALSIGFIIGFDRDRARGLFLVVAGSGTIYALIAIGSFLIDPGKLLWRDKIAYTTVLTTPFINRNTAAMYYGTCTIVTFVLFCHFLRSRLSSGSISFGSFWRTFTTAEPYKMAQYGLGIGICLVATLLTGSRAGAVLTLTGLVLAFTLFFWRDLPRRSGPVMALAIGGLIALVVLQTLGGSVSGRFDEHGLTDPERLQTYQATLRMIQDHPLLGTGLGTFASAFPPYRTGNFWGVWDRAHNTFLEFASEGGIPLAIAIATAWLIILAMLANGVRCRRRDMVYPVTALSVAVICLCHAMVDFSLQIPGFAIVVFALTGVGLAQSFTTREVRD